MSACLAVVPWPPAMVEPVMPALRSASPTATVPRAADLAARRQQVGDVDDVRGRGGGAMIISVHVRIRDVQQPDLHGVVLERQGVLHLDDLGRLVAGFCCWASGDGVRAVRDLFEILLGRRRHDDGRAFRHIGPHSAGMVHMVVGEHQT